MIDENGTKYVFGGDKNSIEYSTSLTASVYQNTTEPWTAVSWLLKEVKDRFGNILYTFNYSRGKRIVQMQNSYSDITRTYEYYHNNTSQKKTEHYPNVYSGTINSPVYLDRISMPDGISITFDHANVYNDTVAFRTLYPNYSFYDLLYMFKSTFPYQDVNPECPYYYEYAQRYLDDLNGAAASSTLNVMKSMNMEGLNAIKINYPKTNDGNTIQKVVNFGYDFSNRMHLSFLIFGDSQNKYGYEFAYNQFDKIPNDYLTKEFDYYGYYNGSPYTTDNLNNCTSNFKYGNMGMLNKITYPTGGYSIFDYEQNDYSRYLSENKQNVINTNTKKTTGGLRISSIGNYDSNGTLLTRKSYKYTDPDSINLSSGQLYGSTKTHYGWVEKRENSNQILQQYTLDVLCSQQPMSNSFAPAIGYSHVIEENLDGSYTSYTYSTCTTEKDEPYICSRPDTITPFDEFSSRQYMRGKLLRQTIFDKNNDSISCTEYTYTSDSEFNKSNFVNTTSFTIHPVFANVGSRYKLYYFNPHVSKITSKTKYGNTWVVDETTYDIQYKDLLEYAPRNTSLYEYFSKRNTNLCTILSETRKRGTTQVMSKYNYAYQFITNSNGDVNAELARQFCLTPISTKQYVDGNLIAGKENLYKMYNSVAVPAYDVVHASNENICDTIAQYISYSPTFRITEMIDESNISHKYYWNNNDQLIGHVTNGSINIGTNATADGIIQSNQSMAFSSKPIDVNLIEYSPFGSVSRITNKNKITTKYDYDDYGRLVSVKNGFNQVLSKNQYKYGKVVNFNPNSNQNNNSISISSVEIKIDTVRNDNGLIDIEIFYFFPRGVQSAKIVLYNRNERTGFVESWDLNPKLGLGFLRYQEEFTQRFNGIYRATLYIDGKRISDSIALRIYKQ